MYFFFSEIRILFLSFVVHIGPNPSYIGKRQYTNVDTNIKNELLKHCTSIFNRNYNHKR